MVCVGGFILWRRYGEWLVFTLRQTPELGENMTGKQKLANLPDKTKPIIVDGFDPDSRSALIGDKVYKTIPVELVRFPPTMPQDLYGKNGATSVTSNQGAAKRSMHTIEFLPELNQFRIIFHGGNGMLVDMVPIHRVNGWTPFADGRCYSKPGTD